MNILITGGLGTLGLRLLNELKIRGFEVWFCDRYHYHEGNT